MPGTDTAVFKGAALPFPCCLGETKPRSFPADLFKLYKRFFKLTEKLYETLVPAGRFPLLPIDVSGEPCYDESTEINLYTQNTMKLSQRKDGCHAENGDLLQRFLAG